MKKILAIVLALIMVMSHIACGAKEAPTVEGTDVTQEESFTLEPKSLKNSLKRSPTAPLPLKSIRILL